MTTKPKATKEPAAEPAFEPALAELETLVERMERGDVSLQESLQMFERGVELARVCQAALRQAENKIQVLMEQNGQPVLTDLPPEDD